MAKYAFDNAWEQARQRLAAIEAWLDPGTIRHLSERGIGPGWRCLEVGAGVGRSPSGCVSGLGRR